MRNLLFSLALFSFLLVAFGQKRTLVILDKEDIKSTHSQFFELLTKRGHTITYQNRDKKITLQSFGEYEYDNLIVMSPNADSNLSSKLLEDFVDSKHNVMVVANNVLSEQLRELATQSGIEFDDNNNKVIDYFNKFENAVVTDKPHSKVSQVESPILHKGFAMALDDDSELLIPILTGKKTSYSYGNEQIKSAPHVSGRRTVIVGGVQTRNSARMTFVSGMELLSNKFFTTQIDGKPTGNKDFASDLTKWSFGEKGILRHRNIFHNIVNQTEMPSLYTVMDEAEYKVTIEELKDDKWIPYIADDIQLEVVMLDPYIRTTLKHIGDGRYKAQFKCPDVYGVFKFVVNYKKSGFSFLKYQNEIVIRPLRINQFERYIEQAFPYYASVFAIMLGFFVFGIAFLYTKEKEKKE